MTNFQIVRVAKGIVMRRLLCLYFIIFIAFTSDAVGAKYGGGSGTTIDPYQIWTAEQMQSIGANKTDWSKNFKLCNDIDLSSYTGEEFNLIGFYTSEHNYKPFSGVFDGNGHTISHFTYNAEGLNYIGLFGYINSETAEIKNIVMTDPNIIVSNGNRIGSLVGFINGGKIINCDIVNGTVSGRAVIGGLAGQCIYGTIVSDSSAECGVYGITSVGGLIGSTSYNVKVSECYSVGEASAEYNVGGLIGSVGNETVISHCCSSGFVSCKYDYTGGLVGKNSRSVILFCSSNSNVSGESYVGGLVGHHEASGGMARLINSHATGNVISSYTYAGGLVGMSGTVSLDGTVIISNCYATGNVSASVNFVGGLVGYNFGNIYKSYATGHVSGNNVIGGLVGAHQTPETISNSYSTGNISGNEVVGGLLGYASDGGIVSNCYSTGDVNGVKDVGCLMGANYFGYISMCFWDTTTQIHGITDGIGDIGYGATTIAGLSTPQMQSINSFISVSWDFVGESVNGENEIWRMCADGVDYPRLSWEFAQNGDFACDDGTDIPDLIALAQNWLTTVDTAPTTFNYACDANGDEQINLEDFAVLGENW